MATRTYSAGTAFLTVVPSFLGVEKAMEQQVRAMAAKVDKAVSGALPKGMAEGAKKADAAGKKAGDEYSSAFAKTTKKHLDAAWQGLPEPQPNMRKWDRALLKVRSDIKDLSGETIGVSIDEHTFITAVDNMRQRLRDLAETAPAGNSRGFFDALQADKQLSSLSGIVREARRSGTDAGDEFASAFETKSREVLTRALTAIPKIKVEADTSEAGARLSRLRDDIEKLSNKTIGIDIDAASFYVEFKRIEAGLKELSGTDVQIDVRTDARTAAAGFNQLTREVEQSADAVKKIDRTSGLSISRLGYLIGLGASLGSVFVPAALAAAGAVGAIGTLALGAVSGLGVFALGLNGIIPAVQALNKYQQDTAKSGVALGAAQNRVANAANGVRQAESALGHTRQTIAEQAADAARRVRDAEQGVADARREAGIAARDSARQVTDATRDLIRAEGDARDVRRDLNAAYREAARDLADLDSAIKNNAIDQDKATTAILKAKQDLDKYEGNKRSTEIELRTAREAYAERLQQLEDLKRKGVELTQDQATANQKGIEGSRQVVAARDKIAAADERVATARERLDRAREQQNEQAIQSARRISDAQQQVGDAQRQQARQQADGQYQLSQATQAVAAAQRSAAEAYDKAGVAGGASMDNVRKAMDNLSPTGQRFAEFIFGLKDEVTALRDAASDPMLPGLQTAITELLPYLPGVATFIGNIAGELGKLSISAVRGLGNPIWQRFFHFISLEAVPALDTLYLIGGNVAEGLVSLFLALTPFNRQVGGGLVALTEDFARWAAELDRTQGYRDFLDYVRTNGPKVVEFLGDAGTLFINLVQAAMPLGSLTLQALTLFTEAINLIPMPVLKVLVTTIGLVSLAIVLLGQVVKASKFKQELTDIFGPKTASMVQTYAIETGRATTETGKFRTAVATAGGVSKTAGTRIAGLGKSLAGAAKSMVSMGGLGGVLAATGLGVLTAATADWDSKVESLTTSLHDVGKAYGDLVAKGKTAAADVDSALRGIVASDPEMQRAVITLDKMGVSFEDLSKAANGSEGDMKNVLAAIDAEISKVGDEWSGKLLKLFAHPGEFKDVDNRLTELHQLRDAIVANADALGLQGDALKVVTGEQKKNNDLVIESNRIGPISEDRYNRLNSAYQTNATRIDTINQLMSAFKTGQNDGAIKADAMRLAIERQTGATVKAIDADETFAERLLGLREQVTSNKEAHDKHATSMDLNSTTALRNRDSLEAAAGAARDLYLEDIAAGVPMDKATKKHNDRIKALKEEADKLGLNKTQTEKLIAAYGEVPADVKTVINPVKGFKEIYDELQQLQAVQYALRHGIDPSRAETEFKRDKALADKAARRATGGPIVGPGTGTSDDVLLWGSNGEFMHRTKAVDYYGLPFMRAVNDMRLPKESLPGYATGGEIQYRPRSDKWPFDLNIMSTDVPTLDEIRAVAFGGGAGDLGGVKGVGGWKWQIKVLREIFPGLPLYSGARPGSRTANNSLSYHARVGPDGTIGRAVDVKPSHAVFNRIHDTWGKDTKELIWGGDQKRNIHNGQHHQYDSQLIWQHGGKDGFSGPSPHIHWAFDDGGMLPPGMTQVLNATGKPEAVLNPRQWQTIEQFVDQGITSAARPAPNYYFTFRDTTLDASRLAAMQARDSVIARQGRAR